MHISRRKFCTAVATLVLSPRLADAQQAGRVYRVAHVVLLRRDVPGPFYDAVRDRLGQLGYLQGRNLDFRFFSQRDGDGNLDAVEARRRVMDEALAWKPDVMLVGTAASARIAKEATSSVPIVFANIQDPQTLGIVPNLARPGGNITGTGQHYDTLSIKRLEVVKELLPGARRVLLIIDQRGGSIPSVSRDSLLVGAGRLGLEITEIDTTTLEQGLCDVAKPAMQARVDAMVTWGNIEAPVGYRSSKPWGAQRYGECLAEIQRQSRIPVVDDSLDTVAQGVAAGLGEDQKDSYRRAADIIARILAGAKPGNIPVDLDMKTQLFVHAASLREMGIVLPPALRLRVDRVIE